MSYSRDVCYYSLSFLDISQSFSKLTVSKCFDNYLINFCSNNSLPRASGFDCTHAPDISNVSDISDNSIGINHLIQSDNSIPPLPPPANMSLFL